MAGEAKELSSILSSQFLTLLSSSLLLLLLFLLNNNIMTANTTSWERSYWNYRGHKVPTAKEMTSVYVCVCVCLCVCVSVCSWGVWRTRDQRTRDKNTQKCLLILWQTGSKGKWWQTERIERDFFGEGWIGPKRMASILIKKKKKKRNWWAKRNTGTSYLLYFGLGIG